MKFFAASLLAAVSAAWNNAFGDIFAKSIRPDANVPEYGIGPIDHMSSHVDPMPNYEHGI